MDDILRASINRQLDEAMHAKDNDRLQGAQVEALKALVDCQSKTALRVKHIDAYIKGIRSRASGARWALRLLNWLFGAGLGGAAIALIRHFGG